MKLGYARCSTLDQNLDWQIDALTKEGCDRIIGCPRIYGKESIVVPDVELFPGHIACSSLSRSEIVVPVLQEGNVITLIDIDIKELNTFDGIDREHLERIADLIGKKWQ